MAVVRYEPTFGSVSAHGTDAALGSLTGKCLDSVETAVDADDGLIRLSGSYELRAKLRPIAVSDRIKKCGRVVHTDPCIVTTEYKTGEREARWVGICLCNRAGCPVCGAVRARKFHHDVLRVLSMGGLWHHVILTVPHTPDETWSRVYERLLDGLRACSKGAVGAIVMPGVEASIRATETTWSVRSGWHVHLHVLWRVKRALLPEEQAILAREWSASTGAHEVHGCRFGMAFDARKEGDRRMAAAYLTKIACEISGSGKQSHPEHWTLGELYQRATEGEYVALVQQYQEQTKGRRIYQLDRRAARLRDAAPELPEREVVAEWVTQVDRKEFRLLAKSERKDPMAIYLPLEVAAKSRGDPSDAIDEHVWYYLVDVVGPPPDTS